jgi:effector-binding domain-containing protein
MGKISPLKFSMHVKVQWNHLSLGEATGEMEDAMCKAYSFLFNFVNTEDGVIPRGRGMYTFWHDHRSDRWKSELDRAIF